MMLRGLLLLGAIFALVGCSSTSGSTGTPTPAATSRFRGAIFDPPRTLTDFNLPSSTGEPFSLSAHRGQIVLLYFGYLTCPDVCPTTMATLQNVYRRLDQPADQVKVVFVSVDPDRDTLTNLTSYTHAFNSDFIGARGEGDDLQQLMKQFGVTAVRRQVGDSPLSYLIDHTASVFLIGKDGRLQAQYLYGTDYRDILHDIQVILEAA